MANRIFVIPVHVTPRGETIMPDGLGGAYVNCYVGAAHYVEAAERVMKGLASDGLHPEAILEPIQELELTAWEAYLESNWREYRQHFPRTEAMEGAVAEGRVIYGPFASYNRYAKQKP